MVKIDTKEWKAFVIGDLFEKLQLDIKNKNFNKALDVSEERMSLCKKNKTDLHLK